MAISKYVAGRSGEYFCASWSSALASDGEGGLWVGLQNGLARLHAGQVEPVRVEPLLCGWVRALQADGPSRLWISTPGGLERLDRRPDATWERHALPVALPVGLGIRKILLDRERNLWVGTNGQGLYRINLHLARRTSPESGLRTATALVSDGAGGAWVAGGCAGLFHLGASGDVQPFAISPGPGLPPVRHCEHSIIGLAYDCDKKGIYAASIAGSTRENEAGVIYQIDSATGEIHSQLKNIDAFGLGVFNRTLGKRLYFGLARKSEVWSVALDSEGRIKGRPRFEFSMAGWGASGDEKARRILFRRADEMILRGSIFNYNLIAGSERPQRTTYFIMTLRRIYGCCQIIPSLNQPFNNSSCPGSCSSSFARGGISRIELKPKC